MKKILISTGELSGDMYAGKLIQSIHHLDPSISFIGMGHQHMRNAGARILADLSTQSTIGFIEPIKFIPKILSAYAKMKTALTTESPDLLILIDYQGFNMRLAKAAKKQGIPVIYYISPQEWQWGSEKGGQNVIQNTDKILSIFPSEASFYNQLSPGHATYVGHPILDAITITANRTQLYHKLNISSDKKIISVFPGSRSQEIRHLLPIFLTVIQQLAQRFSDIAFVLSIATDRYKKSIQDLVSQYKLDKSVTLYSGNPHNLIAHTTLSIVSSGTITLEHACIGTPFIANYKFGRLSYFIAKLLVGKKFKKIKYISLPNILSGKQIAPEFLQDDCTAENIVSMTHILLSESHKYQKIQSDLLEIKHKLGPGNVTENAAKAVLNSACLV